MRPIGIEETDSGDLLVRFDQHGIEQGQAIAMLLGEDVVVLKAAPPSASQEPQQTFTGMEMPQLDLPDRSALPRAWTRTLDRVPALDDKRRLQAGEVVVRRGLGDHTLIKEGERYPDDATHWMRIPALQEDHR